MAGFLDLPTEIRLSVYQYLFSNNKTYLFLYITETSYHPSPFKISHCVSKRLSEVPCHRGILLTCRKCYEEAIDLHYASLTQLAVEFHGLQQDQRYKPMSSTDKRRHQNYIPMALGSLYYSPHHRLLLHRTRHLTVPSVISFESLWDCLQLTLLPSVEKIEFVESQGQVFELCLKGPISPWYRPVDYHPRAVVAQNFNPDRHMSGSDLYWATTPSWSLDSVTVLDQTQIRFLWTTEVEWTRTCSDLATIIDQSSRELVKSKAYQRCYAVRFVSFS